MFKGAWMYNYNLVPMDPNVKFSKGDVTEYRILVGRVRYLLQTMVDLAYSIGIAGRYMKTPKKSHMVAIKQIL